MRLGRTSHLYLGAMRRGRSERSEVGLGLEEKAKGSFGHATSAVGLNVGTEKAAVFVYTAEEADKALNTAHEFCKTHSGGI